MSQKPISTPVTGAELYLVGYINENAICGLATGIYQSASIFRDEDKEHYDTVALVRLSDAQAQLAARDAEIVRLREALVQQKTFHESEDKSLSKQPPSSQGSWRRNQHQEQLELIDEALKGGAA